MKTNGRVLWRWNSKKKGGRKTTSRRPAKSEVASGKPRAYGDFRDFEEWGGGIEALVPPDGRQAATDPAVAEKLAGDRLEELREAKRDGILYGVRRDARLKAFAAHHLEAKARAGNVTESTLTNDERYLRTAVEFFGADRRLVSIGTRDVQDYVAHLRELPNGNGGTLADGTVRKYLNALSNCYRRAVSEEKAVKNPISYLMDKPTASKKEADWLEVHEAALLLEAARTWEPEPGQGADPTDFMYPLLATLLLTGGRKSEVFGLRVSDVSFDRKVVRFRPNEHRRLKTRSSDRSVPLWPQLREVLRGYLFNREEPLDDLLFPSPRTGKMLTDVRKALDAIGKRAGFEEGRIRTKLCRHTYCSVRLQTLDSGAPVSVYTVSRELGHASTAMTERVYSHLGEIRHRSEVVEYRADQFEEQLGERLERLQGAS